MFVPRDILFPIRKICSRLTNMLKEYCLILYFNEEGDKVTRFLEFVDSAWGMAFFPKLRGWVEAKQADEEVKTE